MPRRRAAHARARARPHRQRELGRRLPRHLRLHRVLLGEVRDHGVHRGAALRDEAGRHQRPRRLPAGHRHARARLRAHAAARPRPTSSPATSSPSPPRRSPRRSCEGVERGKYYIIPDALSSFYFRLKGLLPEVFFAIVDGDVKKARKATAERDARRLGSAVRGALLSLSASRFASLNSGVGSLPLRVRLGGRIRAFRHKAVVRFIACTTSPSPGLLA